MNSFRKLPALISQGLLLLVVASASAQPAAPNYLFSHLAGPAGGPGNADGKDSVARFNSPLALSADRSGNIYVAEDKNQTIRKITPDGVVSTLASPDGTAITFSSPAGVAVDNANNIYVSDSARDTIFKITPSGLVSTLAGAPYLHYYNGSTPIGDGRDGNGVDARFLAPSGLATDNAGNLYVADSGNHTIRKIAPGGIVTTLAGTAGLSGNTDGTGPDARFSAPTSVATDNDGNVYVGDAVTVIRKITPAGAVTTLAGTAGQSGSTDGVGTAARFFRPQLAADGTGNILVADTENQTIRRVTSDGSVTTLAGVAGQEGSVDGIGAVARFSSPKGITVDRTGNIYVADHNNFTIRKITPTAVVSTFAGLAGGFGTVDGIGVTARFHFPQGLTVDKTGNLYVADFYNHSIRKVSPTGVVTTLAGLSGVSSSSSVNATGAAARFYYPSGVAIDGNGNLFVAEAGTNSIRKITAEGVVTTFAGPTGSYIFGSTDGPGVDAKFGYPEGIAVSNAGTVYVADTGNKTIRKITPDGLVSTLAGTAGAAGSADGNGAGARFYNPLALTVDGAETVFVADNQTIRKISPDGTVTTLAGVAGLTGSTDGSGSVARFNNPCGLAVDSAGNLFVGDANNLTIRKISPDGFVSTIGGKTLVIGSADGIGSAANFYYPSALAVDSTGTLYVADEFNHAIRKGQLAGPPVIIKQPQSQTVAPGANVQLSVTASGVPAPTYQWYLNGSSFSGATSNTLSFTNAHVGDSGDYTVIITNELGSVISTKAALNVSDVPTSPAPPASSGGTGGGSIADWLILALVALSIVRLLVTFSPRFLQIR